MKKNKQTQDVKINKVVYFDEESAIDYINIIDEGKKSEITDNKKEKASDGSITLMSNIKAKLGAFIFAEAGVKGNAKYYEYSNKVITSTITNTVLTDYLKKVKDNENIKKFENYNLIVYPNSFTVFKMCTPYMRVFDPDYWKQVNIGQINFNELDYVLENAKGYYEFLAEKSNEKTVIFRFNIKALKNNYKLADLIKMNLLCYGIKVGEWEERKLNVEEEFKYEQIMMDIDDIDCFKRSEQNKLEVFDIILAGVKDE
jgi:hypothetical protein